MRVLAGNVMANRNIIVKALREGRQVVVDGLDGEEHGKRVAAELRAVAGFSFRRLGPHTLGGSTMRLWAR